MTPRQLARALRHLADVLEATDDAEALPPLAMSLGVGVPASGADEGLRVRAVTRLNQALGLGDHYVSDSDLYLARGGTFGVPHAFTSLDRVARPVPVVSLDGAA